MKRSHISQLLLLTGLAALALGLVAGWLLATTWQMTSAGSPARWLVPALLVVALCACLFLFWRFVRAFTTEVRDLAEAGRTILTTEASYTPRPAAHPDVKALGEVFSAFGARFTSLQQAQEQAVRQANAALEEERNLLATLMAELTEGVLVCTGDGQILLYNRSARSLLSPGEDAKGSYIGLGRSIFGAIDRNAVTHALDQVQARRLPDAGEASAASPTIATFVTAAANGRLLRIRLAPFSRTADATAGYVLTVQDLSEGIERSVRRDALLQTLTERTRASLGAIRAAIEAIEHFPQMTAAQRARLQAAIHDETQQLSAQLGETLQAYSSDLRAQWRLEEMHGSDLLWSIRRNLARKAGVEAEIEAVDESLWLKIDSYTVVEGLLHLLSQLKARFGVQAVRLRLQAEQSFAALDVAWPAGSTAAEAWQQWKDDVLTVDDSDGVLTLREVAERHGGEVWFQLQGETAYFRLLLPRALSLPASSTPGSTQGTILSAATSRPEYYDFDLFHQPGQHPELDQQPLRSLVYTVFDTETTGLVPGYDEIVAIGALRIVNGRLLRQESFEQLVDPRRPIPTAASDVHGIGDAMVRGQPGIASVLPRFHHFAADTVLVGHNVAFDLRMLQVKEATSGVRFDAPVLDTLLLSSIVHPEADSHSLEAIAHRLGIAPTGRHTALGDALMTGEIFLRLLPLLEAQGIATLGAARAAAEQSYLARLRY